MPHALPADACPLQNASLARVHFYFLFGHQPHDLMNDQYERMNCKENGKRHMKLNYQKY